MHQVQPVQAETDTRWSDVRVDVVEQEGCDMRDMIYLSVGDTTVPFADYEGDTAAYCRGLHDAFRYLGIDSEVSETICHAVGGKPMNVQKVFLLRVAGLKQRDIAEVVGLNQSSVSRDINHACGDVRAILRAYVKPQPMAEFGDVEIPRSMHN